MKLINFSTNNKIKSWNCLSFCFQRVALDQDYRENLREIDRLFADNAQMKAKVEQLEEENKSLEAGLKEVMEAMRKYGATEGEGMEKGEKEAMVMQFPTLERMLAVS